MAMLKNQDPVSEVDQLKVRYVLPYSECINPKDNSFLNKKILDEKFKSLKVIDNNVVFFPAVPL